MSIIKPPYWRQLNKGHPLVKGMVGCWMFNEGRGNIAQDLTGNLSPAAINCANPWSFPYDPKFGKVIYFNSGDNDYVNLGKPIVGTDFSIVLWVRGTGDGPYNAADGYMIGDSTDSANLYFRWTASGTNSITLGIGEDGLGASTSLVQIWHCYIITHGKSGTEAFLYEDGKVLDFDTSFGSNFNGFTSDVWLGNRSGFDRDFDGGISLCMIYDRVLTYPEVVQLTTKPFCIFDSPIRHYLMAEITAGDQQYNAGVLGVAASLHSPTISVDSEYDVGVLSISAGLQAPALASQIAPTALGIAAALLTPTYEADGIYSPAALSILSTLHTPSYNVTYNASALNISATLYDPDIETEIVTLYEYYDVDDGYLLNKIEGEDWLAQTFTIGTVGDNETFDISSVKIKAFRDGSPGDCYAKIYAVDGSGQPTGSALASGSVSANSWTTDTDGEWYEISMSTYELQPSTQYALVISCPDGDAANYVRLRANSSGSYSGGHTWYTDDAGVTWTDSGYENIDLLFQIWGVLQGQFNASTLAIEATLHEPTYQIDYNATALNISADIKDISHTIEFTPEALSILASLHDPTVDTLLAAFIFLPMIYTINNLGDN